MQVSANWNQALKIENVDRKHYKTTLKCGENRKLTRKKPHFFWGKLKMLTTLKMPIRLYMHVSCLCSYELFSLSMTACGNLPSLVVAGLCLYELLFACLSAVLATRAWPGSLACPVCTLPLRHRGMEPPPDYISCGDINALDWFWDLKLVPEVGALHEVRVEDGKVPNQQN